MSSLQPLDNYGAAVVTLKVNKLFPLCSFARSGQDSGITSPRSTEGSPQDSPLRGDSCPATVGESSTGYLLHEEDEYLCVDCPPSNSESFHSKLLALGGPNFSIALLSPESGEVERIPIPMMKSHDATMNPMGFATSSITCAHVVGDCQVWVGTDLGTLHLLDFCPLSNCLANHQLVDMKEKALCISSRLVKQSNGREEVEAVIGFPHGYLVVFTGPPNASGGLENLLTAQRQVVRLIAPNSKQASSPVTSVLFLSPRLNSDTYWCLCGEKLIVLDASTWQQVKEMTVTQPRPATSAQQTSVLIDSEVGVWCAVSSSPCVTLWDKLTYTLEAEVATCKTTDIASSANVTATAFHYPHLFIGTSGGHVLVFEMAPVKGKVKDSTTSGKELRFAAAEGLDMDRIVDILCQPMTSSSSPTGLTFSDSPSEQRVEVLVLGQYPDSASSMFCDFTLLRRLQFTPKPSAHRLHSSTGSTPTASRGESPSALSLHRKSLSADDSVSSSLDFASPLKPLKLTLSSVSPSASTYLPLKQV